MNNTMLMPKNSELCAVMQSTINEAYCFSPDPNINTTTVATLMKENRLTPEAAIMRIFKWMLVDDLNSYERFFAAQGRRVSRANYVAHMRAIISGDKDHQDKVLEVKRQYATPEGLKSWLYPVINSIPRSLGDWFEGDEPLLRAVMLRCFAKSGDIHEFVAAVRMHHLKDELEIIRAEYQILKQHSPKLSQDYQAVSKKLDSLNQSLAVMQNKLEQKDDMVSQLKQKIIELEQSNQDLQLQLARLQTVAIKPQTASDSVKQVSPLISHPPQRLVLPACSSSTSESLASNNHQ